MAPASPPLEDRLFEASIAALELLSVHLGRRLGLYEVVAGSGGITAEGLAALAGIAPRYAQEWLEQQATAGFIEVDDASADASMRAYRMTPAQRAVLVDGADPRHVSPVADMVAGIAGALDALADAYRTGGGVPYAAYGPMLRHGQAGINRPAFTSDLPSWLAAGSADALLRTRPAPRVADVGCGLGWSTIALAAAYPNATVIGYDADRDSVIDARAVAADQRADVTFHNLRAEELAGHGPFDVVLMLEMLHDVSNPVAALSACRAALAPGGALVVVDEKVADTFTPPGDEIERFMYGFSVLHCLPASMAEPGSAALGTVLRSDTVRRLASVAGFSSCRVLDVDAGFFRVYELTG